MNEQLLLHILTGEANSREKGEFYQQLAGNKEDEELFYQVKSLWLKTSKKSTTIDSDAEFNELWKRINSKNRKVPFFSGERIIHYAAVFLLVLGIGGMAGFFISKSSFSPRETGLQKVTATRGSVSIVELQDGTKIWLNSDSQLTFKEDFINKERQASLTGEAYFEVAHNKDFPFLIQTGYIVIRDLGTTFNIKAYPEDNYIETSLVEGKAEVLTNDRKSIYTLEPGESALYFPEENRLKITSVENNVLSAWRNGKFVIRNQRLEDICKELGRWYGITFYFENENLKDYRFTGNIKKSTTAQLVLKVLKTSAGFNYRIIERVEKPDSVIVY